MAFGTSAPVWVFRIPENAGWAMMLRLVLVSIAASLGIQPPDVEQVQSWADGVQVWTTSQLAAWDSRMPGGEGAFLADAAVSPDDAGSSVVASAEPRTALTRETAGDHVAVSDAAFVAVVDRLAMDFAIDPPQWSWQRPVAFEPAVAPDDLYPGVAFALNREAEGWNPLNAVVVNPGGPSMDHARAHVGRLANAVRLTRDAVSAWAGLLNGPAVVALIR